MESLIIVKIYLWYWYTIWIRRFGSHLHKADFWSTNSTMVGWIFIDQVMIKWVIVIGWIKAWRKWFWIQIQEPKIQKFKFCKIEENVIYLRNKLYIQVNIQVINWDYLQFKQSLNKLSNLVKTQMKLNLTFLLRYTSTYYIFRHKWFDIFLLLSNNLFRYEKLQFNINQS